MMGKRQNEEQVSEARGSDDIKHQKLTGELQQSPTTSAAIVSTVQQSKKSKYNITHALEKLFRISMSNDVLADIIIDDNPEHNQFLVVGRPKLLASSTQQMCHVVPYDYIKKALEGLFKKDHQGSYEMYFTNIINAAKLLINSKNGIALDEGKYNELTARYIDSKKNKKKAKEETSEEVFKFTTITREGRHNVHYLIYNDLLISQFSSNYNRDVVEDAQVNFDKEFIKYIERGIEYFKEESDLTDPYTITIICEAISRIILTMFNQDKYAAFPTEGNTLSEEIRLYTNKENAAEAETLTLQKQIEHGLFQVKTHNEIINEIKKNDYNLRIRIVDNEGAIVKRSIKALRIIDTLISHQVSCHDTEFQKKLGEYNKDYKFDIKISEKDLNQYNEILDQNNLHNIFYHHVAKHLYFIFDFKPLEEKVLAPQEKGEDDAIELYPSASGTKKSKYSCQKGKEHRKLQVNRGVGHYNDKVIFRSEMNSEQIKEILTKKVIDCIIISLLSFEAIKGGYPEEETENGMKKVFNSFVKLVQCSYEGAKSDNDEDISLNEGWVSNIQRRYEERVESNILDVSVTSSIPSRENYL